MPSTDSPMQPLPMRRGTESQLADGDSTQPTHSGTLRSQLRWYRPHLAGERKLISAVIVTTLIVLACQATFPLVLESLLHHGAETTTESTTETYDATQADHGADTATADDAAHASDAAAVDGDTHAADDLHGDSGLDTTMIAILAAIMILQLVMMYASEMSAHHLANRSAATIRDRVFARALSGHTLQQRGLVRSSIVSRHSQDVDHVSQAFESTLIKGIPGVLRVAQSLLLLTYLEWRAGVVMMAATVIFIAIRRSIGKLMLAADHDRLAVKSHLEAAVDETISGARVIPGLHLESWQQQRFARLSDEVEHTTSTQGKRIVQLTTAAHTMGLTGLFAVVLFALVVGGESLAAVAASILYVEGVVMGLEKLPEWMRFVQLGAVSEARIDQILQSPSRVTQPTDGQPTPLPDASGLAFDALSRSFESGIVLEQLSLRFDTGATVGLVAPLGRDTDDLLAMMAGDENPELGRITLDGLDVRMPGVGRKVLHVPTDAVAFDVPIREQLCAVDDSLTDEAMLEVLDTVGLAHLGELPDGLDSKLGHSGSFLSLWERQRFALAVALCSHPRVLLLGELQAVTDPETAVPLLRSIQRRGIETVILVVRTADMAEEMDAMFFLGDDSIEYGQHSELLERVPSYAKLWEQRLAGGEIDLSVLGLPETEAASLLSRLLTERYGPGDVVYRQGDPADRILFVMSGHVEISTQDGNTQRRVAVLGPGNHCGDLRLSADERRSETVTGLDDCTVRSLSREAISAGMMGMLDRSPTERRVMSALLREGAATTEELVARLSSDDERAVSSAVALLLRDQALTETDGVYSVVHQRGGAKRGAADILDRLTDL